MQFDFSQLVAFGRTRVRKTLPLLQNVCERLQPVSFVRRFVPTKAIEARKAHGNTRFVTRRMLQSFECHFLNEPPFWLVRNLSYWSETIDSISTHKTVELD